jgi:uncharacterized membrane protein YdjX (TVP38/TMEM64 family)
MDEGESEEMAASTSYAPKNLDQLSSHDDFAQHNGCLLTPSRTKASGNIPPTNPFDSPRTSSRILSSQTFPSLQIPDANNSINDTFTQGDKEEVITLTPSRMRSKSVTFLASECGVSLLNQFDSPIRSEVSPIKGDLMWHSLPDNNLDLYNNNTEHEDYIIGEGIAVMPLRRHTTGVDSAPNSPPSKNKEQDEQTQRSTMSTQSTTDPYLPQHRYCCSTVFMRIIRRICRPHVGRPSCLKCLPCHTKMQPHHQRIVCRSLIIIFMIITITFTLLDLLILHQYLHVWLEGALDWLASNPVAGGLVFIGVILLASLCFFPVSLLALGAGFVYIDLYGLGVGITAAFLVCYSGCLLGAAVCFARSRYLMRQLIQKFANRYPIVRAVDRAFETMGFRLFLLLRLSPAMPFNALNYIGGITAVSFRDYWRATWLVNFFYKVAPSVNLYNEAH